MATKPKSRRANASRQRKSDSRKKVSKSSTKSKKVTAAKRTGNKIPKPATRDIKQLRSAFSKLKKLGLVQSKKRANQVTAKDTAVKKAVSKFADVLSGKAKPLKVSKKDIPGFRKMGIQTAGDKIILPVEPGIKLESRNGKAFRVQELKNGEIRSQILPIPFQNLRQWIDQVASDPSLESLKPKGAKWAFRMYGNNSYATFADLDLMAQYLDNYKSVSEAITAKDKRKQREIFKNLEIVTVKTKTWASQKRTRRRVDATGRSVSATETMREYSRKYRVRLKERYPQRYQQLLERDAERARAYRRKLKRSPKKLEEYRRKARERWQKNKANRRR